MLLKLGRHGYRFARRFVIALIGGTTVLIGLIMIFTPGPGLLVIPLGLAILAIEFAWARYWLERVKNSVNGDQLAGILQRGRKFRIGAAQPPAE